MIQDADLLEHVLSVGYRHFMFEPKFTAVLAETLQEYAGDEDIFLTLRVIVCINLVIPTDYIYDTYSTTNCHGIFNLSINVIQLYHSIILTDTVMCNFVFKHHDLVYLHSSTTSLSNLIS